MVSSLEPPPKGSSPSDLHARTARANPGDDPLGTDGGLGMSNGAKARIALAGAGLVGRRHAEALRHHPDAALCAIADPSPDAGADLDGGVARHAALDALLAAERPDGVILATPNALHAEGALACIEAGVPVLVEKPIAPSVAEARAMVEAAARAGVPLLCGHHRRHAGAVREAARLIAAGRLGPLVALQASAWLIKPDDYFDVRWRREPGGGPILINLIHEVDLVMHLAGPVASVSAMASSATRGFAVEDTAAVALRFASGALGTLSVTDTVPAPWSWELTAGENPAYPRTGESYLRIGGTLAALELPSLALWESRGPRSWWSPMACERGVHAADADPFVRQIADFARVIREGGKPVCSGADGLLALAVVEAIARSAAEGWIVEPETTGTKA